MVDKSTKKLGEVFRKSTSGNENNQELDPAEINLDNSEDEDDNIQSHKGALPRISNFVDHLTKTLVAIMTSSNSFCLKSAPSGASNNSVPVYTKASNTIQINDYGCELPDEIYKTLSSAGYPGQSMKKDSEFLLMKNIKNDIRYTGVRDRTSKRKILLQTGLPKKGADIPSRTLNEEESDELQGEGNKIIITSNKIHVYTR